MSFLTAVLGGIGAYGQGRQQAQQFNLQQQTAQQELAQRQAEMGLEQAKWKEAARQNLANRGYDPSTGQWNQTTGEYEGAHRFVMPQPLTRVVPGRVGAHYQTTPQDYINHYNSLANWYMQTGQSDLGDMAAKNAQEMTTELMRQQAERSSFAKAVLLNQMTSNRDFQLSDLTSQRAAATQNDILNREMTMLPLLIAGREQVGEAVKSTPNYGDLHRLGLYTSDIKTARTNQNSVDTWINNQIASTNAEAVKQAGSQNATVINQQNSAWATGVLKFVALVKKDPKRAASITQQIQASPAMTDSQKTTAILAIQRAADAQQQYNSANTSYQQAVKTGQQGGGAGGGGSNAASNPTSTRPSLLPRQAVPLEP
jgi:hypothetical protein